MLQICAHVIQQVFLERQKITERKRAYSAIVNDLLGALAPQAQSVDLQGYIFAVRDDACGTVTTVMRAPRLLEYTNLK